MEDIRLWGNRLKDEDLAILARLNSITVLSIHESTISDDGLDNLSSISSIKYLSLNDTQVTEKGAERFRRTHPECSVTMRP